MEEAQLNSIFSALADPTRRRILEMVKKKECTVLEISAEFDISLPAVSKHLRVLENALLLQREKNGRFVICRHNDTPLKDAVKWISRQYDFWNQGFEALENVLNNKLQEKEKGSAA